MSGSNAGVPVSKPAATPLRRGPFLIWRGHPSPTPWFGKYEASADHWYEIVDRESEERFQPLCHRCIIELFYRFQGFCDVRWTVLGDAPLTCDLCDRALTIS